jgi:hypothetical protein
MCLMDFKGDSKALVMIMTGVLWMYAGHLHASVTRNLTFK